MKWHKEYKNKLKHYNECITPDLYRAFRRPNGPWIPGRTRNHPKLTGAVWRFSLSILTNQKLPFSVFNIRSIWFDFIQTRIRAGIIPNADFNWSGVILSQYWVHQIRNPFLRIMNFYKMIIYPNRYYGDIWIIWYDQFWNSISNLKSRPRFLIRSNKNQSMKSLIWPI